MKAMFWALIIVGIISFIFLLMYGPGLWEDKT